MRALSVVCVLSLALVTSTAQGLDVLPPSVGPASPVRPVRAPVAPVDPTVERNLTAIVSQGEALPDHVGPAVARAMFDDLAARPALYLALFEQRYAARALVRGDTSLLLSVPLARLRRQHETQVQRLAMRMVLRLEELARTPTPPSDPGFPLRLQRQRREMEILRDGIDVASGPTWRVVPAAAITVCSTAIPSFPSLLRVTRECTCGETLSCRATVVQNRLVLDVRYDPNSPAFCSDCYATSVSCTAPALPPGISLPIVTSGTTIATWQTDASGHSVSAYCTP